MSRCRTRSLNSAATLIVVLAVGAFPAVAQPPNGKGPIKAWSVGRTPDGQPDLQGMWTNYDPTPFEQLRPEEIEPRGPAVSTQDWLIQDSPTSPRRPSMVVDPPSGRIPLKPEAIAKRDAAFAQESD